MPKYNKAHVATANRIARRYGVEMSPENNSELLTPDGLIRVETGATIARRVRSLKRHDGPAYIAVTNREALGDALRAAHGSRVGVMDPQGNIVKRAETIEGARLNAANINGSAANGSSAVQRNALRSSSA